MMMSPESYYKMAFENKSQKEIDKNLKELKNNIKKLEARIASGELYIEKPSLNTQLSCNKKYLKYALDKLEIKK